MSILYLSSLITTNLSQIIIVSFLEHPRDTVCVIRLMWITYNLSETLKVHVNKTHFRITFPYWLGGILLKH